MTNRYADLIDQTFYFPQEGFELKEGYLHFNNIDIKKLIDSYGTPLKLTYLPKISLQIQNAKAWFNDAMLEQDYKGKYHYCYCTKSAHFKYVLDEVLKNDVKLETSSAFDIHLIRKLTEQGKFSKSTRIIHNGFKPQQYQQAIADLIKDGYQSLPVLDNTTEIDFYTKNIEGTFNIGIRMATEEEPNFEFYTSRLGIRQSAIRSFYLEKIAPNPNIKLKMLHFFVDKGIRDSIYYWNEIKKALKLYCQLKPICPDLDAINIGGGLPIKSSLGFDYDYEFIISEIVSLIKQACSEAGIEEPDIYTEFGKYTVGESGATIFSVIGEKQQNDAELWYMVDNSLMTTLPDTWGISERFILLPINKWNNEYGRVNLGGLTCDNSDYYNAETHIAQLFLPKNTDSDKEPLYLGFFHTGAYQDALSGYGGVKHCLIPSPKHLLIDIGDDGKLKHWLNFPEQTAEDMMRSLGY